MTPARPTPATGTFPYPMRTVAEVDAAVRPLRDRIATRIRLGIPLTREMRNLMEIA